MFILRSLFLLETVKVEGNYKKSKYVSLNLQYKNHLKLEI